MDTIKIQIEALKHINKEYGIKYFKQDDNVYLSFNEASIIIIPTRDFYLSFENLNGEISTLPTICEPFKDRDKKDPIVFCENKRAVLWQENRKVKRATLLEYKTIRQIPVYVDEKILKPFGRIDELILRNTAIDKYSNIGVYNLFGHLLGVVAPFKLEEAISL